MNLSGILVVAERDHVDDVRAQLAQLEGVEIHRCDRAGGRIVVVQEADGVAAEVDGFNRIRALKYVLAANLVCHYFGDQPDDEPAIESALASLAAPVATHLQEATAGSPGTLTEQSRGTP